MQDTDEVDERADLVFRVRRYRRQELPLAPVCPHETPAGKARELRAAAAIHAGSPNKESPKHLRVQGAFSYVAAALPTWPMRVGTPTQP